MIDPENIDSQIETPAEDSIPAPEPPPAEVVDLDEPELVADDPAPANVDTPLDQASQELEAPPATEQERPRAAGIFSDGSIQESESDLREQGAVEETGFQNEFQKGQAANQKFAIEDAVRKGYTEAEAKDMVEGGWYSDGWDVTTNYAPAEWIRKATTEFGARTAQVVHSAATGYHSNFFLPRSIMGGHPDFSASAMKSRLLSGETHGEKMYMLTRDETWLLDQRHPLQKENEELYDRIWESSDYMARSTFELAFGVPVVISKLGIELGYNMPADLLGAETVDPEMMIGTPQTGAGVGGEILFNMLAYAVPILAAPRVLKLANGSKRAYAAAMGADAVLAYSTTRPEVGGMGSMLREMGYDNSVTQFLDTRQLADGGWWGRQRGRFIAAIEGVGFGAAIDVGFKVLGVGPKAARWLKGKQTDKVAARKINDAVIAIVDRDMRRTELLRDGRTSAEIEQVLMDEGHGLHDILEGHLFEAQARMLAASSKGTDNEYTVEQALPMVRKMWEAGMDLRRTTFMGMQRELMPDAPNAGLVTLFQKGKPGTDPTNGALAARTLGELEARADMGLGRNKRAANMDENPDRVREGLRKRVDNTAYLDGDLKGNEGFGSIDNPNITVTEDDLAGVLDRAMNRTGEATYLEEQLVADAARANRSPEGRKRIREGKAPYQFAMPDAQFIREALALPDEYRYWYELTAETWKHRVRGLTPAQQEMFFRSLSQHSARTNIKENMDRGVAMFSDFSGGRATRVDSVATESELAGTFRGENPGAERSGMTNYKVPSFAQTFNFLSGFDADAPMSVQDAIMSQMFGMDSASAPGNAAIFETFHSITDELTNHLNSQLLPGAEPYETWQVQALLWTRARRDSTAPPGYLSTGEVAEGFHQVIDDMVDNVLPGAGIATAVDPETGVSYITPEILADPKVTQALRPKLGFRQEFPVLRAQADQVNDPKLKEFIDIQMRYENMLSSGEMVTAMTKNDRLVYQRMVTKYNNILQALQSDTTQPMPGGGEKKVNLFSELSTAIRGIHRVEMSGKMTDVNAKMGGQEFGAFNKDGEWFGPLSSRNGTIGPDLTLPLVHLNGDESIDFLAMIANDLGQTQLSASQFTRLSQAEGEAFEAAIASGRDDLDTIIPEVWVPGSNVSIAQVRQLEQATGMDITVRPSATGSTVWVKPRAGAKLEPGVKNNMDQAFDDVLGDSDWEVNWSKMDEITVSENGWFNATTGERGKEGIRQRAVMAESKMLARDVSDDMGQPEWMAKQRAGGSGTASAQVAKIWDQFLGSPEAREEFLTNEDPAAFIQDMIVSEAKELGKRFQRAGEVPTKNIVSKAGRKKSIDFERIAQDNDPEGFQDAITEAVEARNGKALTDKQRADLARDYVDESGLYPFSERELALLEIAGYNRKKVDGDYGGAGKALRVLKETPKQTTDAANTIISRSGYVRQRHHRAIFAGRRDKQLGELEQQVEIARTRLTTENTARQKQDLETQFMKDQDQQVLGSMQGDEEFGNAVIRLGQAQTMETVFHEGAHAVRIQAITGPKRGQVISIDSIRGIEAHYGVVDGKWNGVEVTRGDRVISADEAFAEDFGQFVMEGKVPDGMKEDDWKLLVAQSRDQLEDIRAGEQLPMGDAAIEMHGKLQRMEGLPIRMPDGTYVKAIEWDDVVRRVEELQAEGKDWMDILDETDTWVGTARMNKEIKAGNTPGKHSNTFKLDVETEDDIYLMMSVFEDLHRVLKARGVIQGDAATRAGGMKMLNASMGRSPSQFKETVDELLSLQLNKDDLAQTVWAANALFLAKARQARDLAKKAQASGDPRDKAILHKAMMDYHYMHASALKTQSNVGRGLRAYKLPAFFPSTKKLQDPKYVEKYVRQMGLDGPYGDDLIDAAASMDVPNDISGASTILKAGAKPWGSKALDIVNEVYVNGLLSGLTTVAGISTISPLLTMTVQGGQKFMGGVGHAVKTGFKGGGLKHMDWSIANEVLLNLQRNYDNLKVARQMAARTARTDRGILMPGRELVDQGEGKAIYTDKGPAIWQALVNYTGAGIRLPQRGIMTVDEFFRQVNGRTTMQSMMYREEMDELVKAGIQAGDLDPTASVGAMNAYKRKYHRSITEKVEQRMDQVMRDGHIRNADQLQREAMNGGMTEDGRLISEIEDEAEMLYEIQQYATREGAFTHSEGMSSTADLVQAGEAGAVDPVFQADLEGGLSGKVGAGIQAAVDIIPGGRLVVPFVRTPWNIAERFGGYIVPTQLAVETVNRAGSLFRGKGFRVDPDGWIAQVHYKHMQEIGSGDPRLIAHARGRQAMGVALWSSAAAAIYSGTVTGGGPTDPTKRKAWLSAGNKPYSIHMPGMPPISYSKLDPYASILGTMADTAELMMYYEGKGEDQQKIGLLQAMMYSFTNQLKEKSFVAGISDLMTAIEESDTYPEGLTKYINQMTVNLTTPFSSLQNSIKGMNDPYLMEYRDLLDTYTAKSYLSLGSVFGAGGELPPRYTVIGEPMERVSIDTAGYLKPLANLASPARIGEISDDPIYIALSKLGAPPAGMNNTRTFEERNFNLTAYTENEVDYPFTAKDYMGKMVGEISLPQLLPDGEEVNMTLKEFLQAYVLEDGPYHDIWKFMAPASESSSFARVETERSTLVRDAIARYRTEAFERVRLAFPNLWRDIQDNRVEKLEHGKLMAERAPELGMNQVDTDMLDKAIEVTKQSGNESQYIDGLMNLAPKQDTGPKGYNP